MLSCTLEFSSVAIELEREADAHLDLARRRRTGHPACAGAAYSALRCVEDRMVEGVEELHSEVQGFLLPHGERFV